MNAHHPMYRWRRMTLEQRKEALEHRQRHRLPWHGPPHYEDDSEVYLISAACYEHKPVISRTAARMADFEAALLEDTRSVCQHCQGNKHRTLQLMVNHDDSAREYAYAEKDRVSLNAAQKSGWHVVSMKSDWQKVFAFEK
jgi:hypothetical protein